MPNVAGLNIVLGADFTQAEQAMDRFNGKVNQFVQQFSSLFASAGVSVQNFNTTAQSLNTTSAQISSSMGAVSGSFQENIATLSKLKQELADVQGNMKILGQYSGSAAQQISSQTGSIEELRQKEVLLKAQIAETNKAIKDQANSILGYDTPISSANRGFNSLGYTATRTFHGLAELMVRPGQALLILSNDIPQLITRYRELSSAQRELAEAGKPALSTAQLLAAAFDPLTIAIQLGITALIRYAPELYKWATGADEAEKKAKALKEQQDALNQITESSNRTAGQQIATIETLNATMTNNKLSMEQRTNAYNEALKLYPSYLDGVSKDAALNGGLADIINTKLIPAILAAAQARALNDKIAKLSADNIDLEDKQSVAVINTAKAYANLQKAKADAKNVSPTDNPDIIRAYYTEVDIANQKYKSAIQTQEDFMKQIGANSDTMKRYAGDIQNASTQLGHLDASGKDIGTIKYGTDKKSGKTAQNQLQDILKSMNESIANTQLDLTQKLINPEQADKRITEAINRAISKVQQLNIPDKDTIISKLMGQYPADKIDLTSLKGVDYDKLISNYEKAQKSAADSAKKLLDTYEKEIYNPLDESINDNQSLNRLKDKYEKSGIDWEKYLGVGTSKDQFKNLSKQWDKFNTDFNKDVSKWGRLLTQPLDSFVDAIFKGQNAFQALGQSVLGVVEKLIATAAEAGIISALLGGTNEGKAASGGGGSLFGKVFGSLVGLAGSVIPFLADGGVVTGPTIAMVGEAGKEAVIPLDRLNQFTSGSQDINVNIRGIASGRDLALVNNNYQVYKER